MEKTKKVAPKPTVKKVAPTKAKVIKPAVEMVSYSIKMVIPTGQYANIQPEIIVRAGSVEEAHNFIAPHMNKLWKEYYLVNERRPETVKPVVISPAPQSVTNTPNYIPPQATCTSSTPMPPVMTVQATADALGGKVLGGEVPAGTGPEVAPPDSSVALIKATQAIESCTSLDALDLIQNQVIKSVKLSKEDKDALMPLIDKKAQELFEPEVKEGNEQ